MFFSKRFYKVFGINRYSDDNQIKKACRSLAMKYHSDKNSEDKQQESTIIFEEINRAYEILSDTEKRKQYDLTYDDNVNLLPSPDSHQYYGAADVKRNYQQLFISILITLVVLYFTISNILPSILSYIRLSNE